MTTAGTIVPGTVDVGNHCDDCSTAVALPFQFQLYDQLFSSVSVGSNGYMAFGTINDTFYDDMPAGSNHDIRGSSVLDGPDYGGDRQLRHFHVRDGHGAEPRVQHRVESVSLQHCHDMSRQRRHQLRGAVVGGNIEASA